jgi:hypothetical protein
MTYAEFIESLQSQQPPSGLSPYLTALWHERRNDWHQAHEVVQEIETVTASRVHAYLHRREGDESNARYWYSRAERSFPDGQTLDEEWESLARELL